ncbi:hypothetical protein EIN_316450 [Entamoeba invadens IP1]|uniref:Uncharacterized protein n=1 Tax=Entamoeba invadens IP1 TaxID=370355 RepID=A0A0A1U5B5_ENTIV|nr:hypothetical protein EIN_316450 [Entamoeba invadens IP1]ELP86956.1 hypothetical protein EIN_316450 [Entamoeba invadens IP1]|eukprot:XP_004253727.1 hypothetical protein EIN_316450 [Entamoeba invadens IP1]
MGGRYGSLNKLKLGVLKFLESYKDVPTIKLAQMIVDELIEQRVRPLPPIITNILVDGRGDPFCFVLEAIRFALVPFIDAAKGLPTKYGENYPDAMNNLFTDTVVVTVDAARQLFKNDLRGVETYIHQILKNQQKTSGKNARFNEMSGAFGSHLILEKYCKARNVNFVPSQDNLGDLMESIQPMMSALGTVQEIVRDFPIQKNTDEELLSECFKLANENDIFYECCVGGKSVIVYERMDLTHLLNSFGLEGIQEPPETNQSEEKKEEQKADTKSEDKAKEDITYI